MFNEKDKVINKIGTLIGERCTISGTIQGEDVLRLDGYIEGDINWKDDVILGNASLCKGNIYCKSAIIEGKVEGNVLCQDTLTIEMCGNVKGDITVKNLVIKEGGILEGKCNMLISNVSKEG